MVIHLIALLGVLVTTTARAQEDKAATEAARVKFQEGVRHFDRGQFDKARLAFSQAYQLKKHPSVLLNLAQSELRTPGQEPAAAQHFAQYLRESTDAKTRAEAEKGLATAQQKVGAIVIQADVDGAEVLVDGEPRGVTPLPDPIYLKPGTHKVEVRQGDSAKGGSVVAAAGQTQTIVAKLARPAAPPTPPPVSRPGGEEDRSGREPFFKWLFGHPAALGLGAGVVVGAAATGTLYFMSRGKLDKADEQKDLILAAAAANGHVAPCNFSVPDQAMINMYWTSCERYSSLKDDGEAFMTGTYVAAGVTGAALVALPVAYLLDTSPGRRKRAEAASVELRLVPALGAGVQGLGVVGRF